MAVRPTAAPAQASTSDTRMNIGSALASVVYSPVKLAYAAVGATFGGIAWGLSGGNTEVMQAILTPAVRGDYAVTPAHLRGERKLEFVGSAAGSAYAGPEPAAVSEWGEYEDPYGEDAYR